jgi:hypothetical protein
VLIQKLLAFVVLGNGHQKCLFEDVVNILD